MCFSIAVTPHLLELKFSYAMPQAFGELHCVSEGNLGTTGIVFSGEHFQSVAYRESGREEMVLGYCHCYKNPVKKMKSCGFLETMISYNLHMSIYAFGTKWLGGSDF